MAYFNKEAICNAKKCDYFSYAKNSIFGVCPYGLVSPDLLTEIKARAAGSAGRLEGLKKNSNFIQTQLQMVCTGTKYCIIMSYHPESTSDNYFLVIWHNFLWYVNEIVVNSIYHKTPIQEWSLRENVTLQNIKKGILRRVSDFESLKALHTYINEIANCVQQIKFE